MLGGRFSQAFFFSIQTFATIGYGQIGPNGLAANVLVTVEALVGLMYQALATGLLFARFRAPDRLDRLQPPRHRRAMRGDPRRCSSGSRIGGGATRSSQLEAQVLFTAFEPNDDGQLVRSYRLLPLERNKVTLLPAVVDDRAPD